jgi:DNA polymerase-1
VSRYIFDIETNGLLKTVTKLWVFVAYDIDKKVFHVFEPGDMGWKTLLDNATLVVGHNILGFDLPALEKLYGYVLPKTCNTHDTLILSRVLDYRRFGSDGHALERWGEFFVFPKGDFNDWENYSPEMREYCIRDVELSTKVYTHLMSELLRNFERIRELKGNPERLKTFLRAEQAATKWSTRAHVHGWPFNVAKAKELYIALNVKMQEAYNALNARLGMKTVAYDKCKGIVETKRPKWVKSGAYDAHTANWFGIDPWSGFEGEERLVEGEYCRVTFVPLSLDSVADVKVFLFRNGWVPTEYNTKLNEATGRKEPTSPKITEDSLEFLGGDGVLYTEFLTAKSRFSILKTWLENVDENGNLHGDCMVIGTPSMRATHRIIVNVPSADSPWGKEMRSLFGSLEGWTLIGCDSAGNQARGLAHYLGDATFIDTLLNGDIHQYNADILTNIVRGIKGIPRDFVVTRSQAKRILYAFLFGASGSKLWMYIFGKADHKNGTTLKNQFIKAVPGFKVLLEKLGSMYTKSMEYGDGYIYSLANNKIYVDSYHKLLVYLLQAAEKATCSTALMYTVEHLEAEGIPYIPCIYYHDEIDFMVPDEYAERAAAIGKAGFKEGPKLYGVEIMDGDAKMGRTWYDVH